MAVKSDSNNLQKVLQDLGKAVRHLVEQEIADGKVFPSGKIRYLKKKILSPGTREWTTEDIYRDRWDEAAMLIPKKVKEISGYSEALDLLVVSNPTTKAEQILERLTLQIFADVVKKSKHTTEERVDTLCRELRGEPVKCRAVVELTGMVVKGTSIELSSGDSTVYLRDVEIEDLEKEYLAEVTGWHDLTSTDPSAMMKVEKPCRTTGEVQIEVHKAIAMLRLFGVGSVQSPSYTLCSDSILSPHSGTLREAPKVYSSVSFDIDEKAGQRLGNFWEAVAKVLPENFYRSGEEGSDHKAIAYQRYCDALMRNGLLERRISSGVMGLESLYSPGGAELGYRLRNSVAKVLSYLGFDSLEVKGAIKNAYSVRGSFVHGDVLSSKEKIKLGQKYGDIEKFTKLVLDFLRLSILVVLPINRSKNDFIELIEDSLVNDIKGEELKNLVCSVVTKYGSDV